MSESGEAVPGFIFIKQTTVRKLVPLLLLPFLLAACGTPKNFQHALYLQDSVTEAEKAIVNSPAVILPGDRLSIDITAINKEAAADFNIQTAGSAGTAAAGYLVDTAGDIQLLQLGKIHVSGMTTDKLADTLQAVLVSYVKGPVVNVTISNFKINMLGEVGHPGVLIVPDGKINILEAITQSGDLTLYGRRDNILVIRTINGKREFGRLDISSNHVFESPYYNLKQNDMIYVESDKTKFLSNDVVTTRNIRNFGFAVAVLTTLILVVNLFK